MINSKQFNLLSLALYQPRIPQNCGNIARTCAAFNLPLHLIEPLGFSLDDKYLKRAGLDYWPYMDIKIHKSFVHFCKAREPNVRLVAFSKTGDTDLKNVSFIKNDILILGREDIGLPSEVRDKCDLIVSIPMPGGVLSNSGQGVRSLNLSSAASIIAYQACSKLDYL